MPNMSFALTGVTPTPSMTLARTLPQGVDEIPTLSPLALFQAQMSSGSTEAKVDAMKRLHVVARAMCENANNEAVMTQLVPYLQSLVLQQGQPGAAAPAADSPAASSSQVVLEDEILLMLTKQLQAMVPSLLSTPSQILALLPILERLAAVEETVVRDQAVETVQHVAVQLQLASANTGSNANTNTNAPDSANSPPPLVEPSVCQTLVNMARRCATADWFTPKVSIAGMIPTLYQVTHHTELPFLYRELCQDDTPMVRRAASKSLGKMLAQLGNHASQQSRASANELATVSLRNLCQDEQDSVRMLAVACLADVGTTYGNTPQWTKEHFVPFVRAGSTDMSWRVRHNLAKHFSSVAQNLGFGNNSDYTADKTLVMSCFASLLTDVEPEVRAAAVGHFAPMVHWGGAELFQSHLQPLLPSLADDLVMEVRSKCALAIMDSSQGGTLEDSVIVQSFGPLLESFLQDEFQDVQLQVLHNLGKLSHLLNGMNGVVSTILSMARANNWRVREGVGRLLPHLCQARGPDFFANVLLEPSWLPLLLDPVASVRSACVGGMETLVRTAGQEWMVQHILPQHVRIYNHAASGSYLIRITILQTHAATAVACAGSGGSSLWDDVVLQLLRGLADNVANVRMVAAKGLAQVVKSAKKAGDTNQMAVVETKIQPALQNRLAEEKDPDCRDSCQMALDVVGSPTATPDGE